MQNTEENHLLSTQNNVVTTTNNINPTEIDNESNSSHSSNSSDKRNSQKRATKNAKKEDEIIFGGRFECNKNLLLGSGTFGEIYLGIDTIAKEYVAVKLEKPTTKEPQLRNEKVILDVMFEVDGFPKIHDFGAHLESTYLAMALLGPSTGDLFEYCGYKYTLQTVLLLAIQMIERIQELHSKNYIHRDIKPENYTVGIGSKSTTLYLIDFGLAKKYKDTKTMEHITYRETKEMTGTPRFASINNHLGIEQSRRDDLEGIAYVLIYFMKRRLPWQNIEGKTVKEKYKKILEKKMAIPVETLCKDLPVEFEMMLSYARNLRFDERPDYTFLKGIFTDLLFDNYFEEFVFDWTITGEAKNKKIKEDKNLLSVGNNARNNPDMNNSSKIAKDKIEESDDSKDSESEDNRNLMNLGEDFIEKNEIKKQSTEGTNKGYRSSIKNIGDSTKKLKEVQFSPKVSSKATINNPDLINFD